MMKRISSILAAVAALALSVSPTRAQQPDDHARLASFEMAWKARKPAEVAALALAAAQIVAGRELHEKPVATSLSNDAARRQQIAIPEAPGLDIVYLPAYDELRVTDAELASALSPEREVSQDDAMKIAKTALDELARHDLANPAHYSWDRADVAYTYIGGASRESKATQRRRIEYRFTLRRSLNGVELANAGVRIVVHASGRVSGLRLGGVTVATKTVGAVEEPTGAGRWLTPRARIDDLKARFEREALAPKEARRKIAWSRVMYVAPETSRRTVVEPMYVVSYSLEVPTDDGAVAISRRKTIGYSLIDADAAPVDLTPPARKPAPDRAIKRTPK